MFQATRPPPPNDFNEKETYKEQLGVRFIKKNICYECWQQLHSLTHTVSGQGTSHEHTKRPFIAFRGTLLSQSMGSCLPGCVTGDQSSAFTLRGFDKALTQHQAECCWPSKQCPSLELHSFVSCKIPSRYRLYFTSR